MASKGLLVIDSTSYSSGMTLRQMRLSIKIRITSLNSNTLGYLPKYKSPLPPPVKLSGPKPYTYVVHLENKKLLLSKLIDC